MGERRLRDVLKIVVRKIGGYGVLIIAGKTMATHLNLKNLKKNEDKKDTKLHWMPCVIHSDGEAKVSQFFEPIITKREDEVLQASFRGHPLLGKVINVPKNYTGVVLQQTNERLSEESERDLYGVHLFDKFTYWNWDIEPSCNDKIIGALDWLDIAEALHSTTDS